MTKHATTQEEVLEFLSSGGAKTEDLVAMRTAINEVVPEQEDEAPYWESENPKTIVLGEREINLVQIGRPQLDQIGKLRDWMNTWARPIMDLVGKSSKDKDGKDGTSELGIEMIIQLLEPAALLELAAVIIMQDKEFAEEYFDIGWVLDAAGRIIKHQPAIRRLTQGFFGRLG